MKRIRILPDVLVNRIAAGEVIERPSSVVKELVENALDAGASRIRVCTEEGGCKLIQVIDNGHGMDDKDLMLALISHATSKLPHEDLFRIDTLGFRGEALASIGAVSKVRIISRPATAASGHSIVMHAGSLGKLSPAASAPGTNVKVQELFLNVPARKAFLKTPSTEIRHVTEVLTCAALANPCAGFTLTHHERAVLTLPGRDALLDRIEDIFGAAVRDCLVPLQGTYPGMRVSGYLGRPDGPGKRNRRHQYFFVNGRWIRNRTIYHAVAHALEAGLMHGDPLPPIFLFLQIPPDDVDVNVHPTKQEIRFRTPQAVHDCITGAVRDAVTGGGYHPHLKSPPDAADDSTPARTPKPSKPWWRVRETRTGYEPDLFDAAVPTDVQVRQDGLRNPHRAFQLHQRIIVEETEEGVLILDQHALHERILFEAFKDRVAEGRIAVQNLLVPEIIDLSHDEWQLYEVHRRRFAELGVAIESYSDRTIAVTGLPSSLPPDRARDVVMGLLEHLFRMNSSLHPPEILEGLLETMACKAAVKAGDVLSQQEIDALLRDRDARAIPHTCPHGRPWAVLLTLERIAGCVRRK